MIAGDPLEKVEQEAETLIQMVYEMSTRSKILTVSAEVGRRFCPRS